MRMNLTKGLYSNLIQGLLGEILHLKNRPFQIISCTSIAEQNKNNNPRQREEALFIIRLI